MIRILCFGIGYLFGLFQTSYIIGLIHGIDIRDYGSGNAGTANMIRTMGTKWGLITFAGDFLKSYLACVVVGALFSRQYPDCILLSNSCCILSMRESIFVSEATVSVISTPNISIKSRARASFMS